MFEACHSKDADFNAKKLATLWTAVTQDSEVTIGLGRIVALYYRSSTLYRSC
jgi:hypothetical protein